MFIDANGKLRKPVAYLGGYEMFYENALERAERMKALCARYGIMGISPPQEEPEDEFTPYIPKDDSHPEMAWMYFTRDINHLKRSDMIIAELGAFYGTEVESGTAFECGVAAALGKRLYGYIQHTPPVSALREPLHILPDGKKAAVDDAAVAEFDLPVNVLFHDFKITHGGLEDVLRQIRKDLDAELSAAGYEPYQMNR